MVRPAASPTADRVAPGRRWTVLVVLGIVAGVALRWWLLHSDAGATSSDEAVVGLMARHLLDGEWRAFFWGQRYGGTPEVAAVAALTWATGAPVLSLKLVPVALSAVAAVLVWRVGRRLVGEPLARAAGLLFWVSPAAYAWLATRELGFYWASSCIGLLTVLCAQRLVDRGDARGWWWLGALAGLGWWVSPFCAYALAPVGLWMAWRHPRTLTGAWRAVPTAVVAAAPWLWHNLGTGWPSLHTPPQPEEVSHLTGLGRLVWGVLPMTAGLRHVRTERWLFPGAALVFVALVAAFAVVALRRRMHPLLGLGLLCAPVIYVLLPGRWWVGDARYGLPLWPFLAIAAAWALGSRRRAAVAVGVAAVLAVAGARDIGASRPPAHLGADVRALEAAGIDRAWADYWLAYRTTFESGERVVVAPITNDRYRPYRRAVAADRTPAVVFLAGDPAGDAFLAAIRRAGRAPVTVRTPHLVAYRFDDGPLPPP